MKRNEGRKTLYIVALIIHAVLLLGTFGAIECDYLTISGAMWQIIILFAGAFWWWNLIRIEETRAARSRR